MPDGGACLLDSNILLRISKSDDPQYAAISHALHALVGQGARLCYTSQTLGEFWNASARVIERDFQRAGLRASQWTPRSPSSPISRGPMSKRSPPVRLGQDCWTDNSGNSQWSSSCRF